ncbi:MAG: hypothetical protein O9301_02575 [Leptospira sp.]|nr:hypothetical protein [Leptospira sp.]
MIRFFSLRRTFQIFCIGIWIVTVLACAKETKIVQIPYHPYFANKLCPLEISGDLNYINSISILLEPSNVMDYEGKTEIKEFVLVKPGTEYFLDFEKQSKNFRDKIPCRNQTIRLQYSINDTQKKLDVQFDASKPRKILVFKSKNGNEMYEKK